MVQQQSLYGQGFPNTLSQVKILSFIIQNQFWFILATNATIWGLSNVSFNAKSTTI
jgi:hypothetical protein